MHTRALLVIAGSALVVLGLAAGPLGCSFGTTYRGFSISSPTDRTGVERSRTEEGTIDPALVRVIVDNKFGTVDIEATDGPGSWRWELKCWAKDAASAEDWCDRIALVDEVDSRQGTWRLKVPDGRKKGLSGFQSNLTLRVPRGVAVQVDNGFGPTRVEGVRGDTVVKAQHGSLKLTELGGRVEASNSFGTMEVVGIAQGTLKNKHGRLTVRRVAGDLEASTSYGLLDVQGIDGRLIARNQHGKIVANDVAKGASIETSFGTLEATDVTGAATFKNRHGAIVAKSIAGPVDATTSFGKIALSCSGERVTCHNRHGAVELDLSSERLDRVDVETSFGSLRVALPAITDPNIDAKTSFGKVKSDWPVSSRGATAVELRNSHGGIWVKRKDDETM